MCSYLKVEKIKAQMEQRYLPGHEAFAYIVLFPISPPWLAPSVPDPGWPFCYSQRLLHPALFSHQDALVLGLKME